MWGESVEAMGGMYRRQFPLNYQMGARVTDAGTPRSRG